MTPEPVSHMQGHQVFAKMARVTILGGRPLIPDATNTAYGIGSSPECLKYTKQKIEYGAWRRRSPPDFAYRLVYEKNYNQEMSVVRNFGEIRKKGSYR